jgi:hypothetical protein
MYRLEITPKSNIIDLFNLLSSTWNSGLQTLQKVCVWRVVAGLQTIHSTFAFSFGPPPPELIEVFVCRGRAVPRLVTNLYAEEFLLSAFMKGRGGRRSVSATIWLSVATSVVTLCPNIICHSINPINCSKLGYRRPYYFLKDHREYNGIPFSIESRGSNFSYQSTYDKEHICCCLIVFHNQKQF